MDGTNLGETGVISWCNNLRLSIAKDPGRAVFHTQIEKHGFEFLDDYLTSIVSRPREEPMYELLKTPGRRKDAPKRTRAATAAAAKSQQAISNATRDNQGALNSFHKALLEAKDQERDEDEPQPSGTQAENDFGNTVHVKLQKVVTIADSPDIPRQQINVGDPPIPQLSPGSLSSHNDNDDPTSLVHHTEPSLPELSTNSPSQSRQSKELSMIAEADEPGERSRQSMQSHHPDEDIMDDMEATVPIREDGSTHTLIGKASVSQFVVPAPSPLKKSIRPSREHSGGTLPAPTLSQTPGSVFAGKRTSWLTKAKETRALEMTGSGKAPYSERTTFLSATLNAAANSAKRKSGEMLGLGSAASTVENLQTAGEDDRQFKVPRLTPTAEMESDSTSKDVEMEDGQYPHSKSQAPLANEPISDNVRIAAKVTPAMMDDFTVPLADVQSDEGVLDRLKRTVEDLGARTAKSMGKSLGGGAAAELAEARAAALARVAERNKEDGVEVIIDPAPDAAHPEADLKTGSPEVHTSKSSEFNISASNQDDDRRFSLSDLVISSKSKVDQQSTTNSREFPDAANISTSTTPPCSPPPAKNAPDAPHPPVFSKPSVFSAPSSGAQQSQRLPVSTSDNDFSFKLPRTNPFSLPAAMALGVPATLPSSSNQIPALSAHSSKGSIFSDAIFDKQDDHPSWMPRTQDTDYSTQLSQVPDDLEDEDDSYRVDPSLKANQMWTPFGLASEKDDTMTWSTLPSRSTSQKGGDTGPVPTEDAQQALDEASHRHFIQPPSDDEGNKAQLEIDQADLDIGVGDMSLDNVLDDIVASGKATITLVEPKPGSIRSQSQLSMASTSSSSRSQSQLGFFGQASKLVSSVLGGGKKTKPEPVKSIQRAAAAARKQQEEAERKASRLKEMENRRQQTMQRKADEEKVRALEEERKFKEEADRRKKEREESTDKRSLKSTSSKKPEDDTMNRKVVVQTEKKIVLKKPPSREGSSRIAKPAMAPKSTIKSAMKPATTPATPTQDAGSSRPTKTLTTSKNIARPPHGKGKTIDEIDQQPSQLLQSQMVHRAKAHLQATQPREPPPVASESIELPDINSEYSDSEDEDRVRTYDPPQWAQSPELRQQLQQQSTLNPDHVFGPIVPLQIEDMFKTKTSRLKARSSSANWNNGDAVTAEEVRRYNEQMGFK